MTLMIAGLTIPHGIVKPPSTLMRLNAVPRANISKYLVENAGRFLARKEASEGALMRLCDVNVILVA